MGEITRAERNQFQSINRIKDVDSFQEVRKVYQAIITFMDQERSTGRVLSKIESTTRAELKGYIKVLDDAVRKINNGNKITSALADDLKEPIRKMTKALTQLESEANTRHKKDEYITFNKQLADATAKAMTRVYKDQEKYHTNSIVSKIAKPLKAATDSKVITAQNTPWKIIPSIAKALPKWVNHSVYAKNAQFPENVKRRAQGYSAYNDRRSSASGAQYLLDQQMRAQSQLHGLFYGTGNPQQMARFYASRFNSSQYFATSGTSGMTLSPQLMQAVKNYYTGQTYGPIQPSRLKRSSWKLEDSKFGSKFGNVAFFQNLHKMLGSLPVIGKITGGLSKASVAGTAGKALLGGIGIAVGAIAVAVSSIYKQMKKASPVLQAVSNLFELAWNLLWMPLGNALGTALIPLAETMIEFALSFNRLFSDFSFETLLDFTMRIGEVVGAALQTLFNILFDVLYSLADALPKLLLDLLFDGLEALFNAFGWNDAVNVLKDIRNWVDKIRTTIHDWIRALPSILSGLPNVLLAGLKSLLSGGDFVEGVKNRWNETIGSWTGIKLATGGVVTNPTIAMVGEAGPEAVIPLDRANGIGTTYVININGDVYGVQDLESRIERAIQRTANKAYYR